MGEGSVGQDILSSASDLLFKQAISFGTTAYVFEDRRLGYKRYAMQSAGSAMFKVPKAADLPYLLYSLVLA